MVAECAKDSELMESWKRDLGHLLELFECDSRLAGGILWSTRLAVSLSCITVFLLLTPREKPAQMVRLCSSIRRYLRRLLAFMKYGRSWEDARVS